VRKVKLTALAAVATLAIAPAAQAGQLNVGGSTGLQLLAQKLADKFETTHSSITIGRVKGGGSGAGVRNANSGVFDIGTSSRDPASNDPTGLVFTPITKEPFAVIINPKNPIRSLTKDQIKGIFTGAITKWSEVGWAAGGTIAIGSRIGTSGTLATFRTLFLDGAAITSSAVPFASNGLDRSFVANTRNTNRISFVTFAYVATSKSVKAVRVSNVVPSLQNVISGRYKYWGYQYLVTKGAPAGDAKTFIDWIRGSQGAAVMKNLAIPTQDAPKTT
jgi:phosphate transport system substrate-binding protein